MSKKNNALLRMYDEVVGSLTYDMFVSSVLVREASNGKLNNLWVHKESGKIMRIIEEDRKTVDNIIGNVIGLLLEKTPDGEEYERPVFLTYEEVREQYKNINDFNC